MEVERANRLSNLVAFPIRTARAIPLASTASVGTLATVDRTPSAGSRITSRFARASKDSTVIRRLNVSRSSVALTMTVPVNTRASTGSAYRYVRWIHVDGKPNATPRTTELSVSVCQATKAIHESAVNCWDVEPIRIARWIRRASTKSVRILARTRQSAPRTNCAKCTNIVPNVPVRHHSKRIQFEDACCATKDAEPTVNVHRRRLAYRENVSTRAT